MIIFLILGLILGALSVIFALQNVIPITVTFFAWQLQGSLSLILLLAVLAGVMICGLLSVPEVIRNHIRFTTLKNQKKDLEKALETLRAEKEKVEHELATANTTILPPLL
ncbi:MAG: lipopolysaccharide assembly protein LapA domain-containing protein [Patescibacteria group bacterium]